MDKRVECISWPTKFSDILADLFMSHDHSSAIAHQLTPILCVRDFQEAMRYYTEKLLFKKLWEWGEPPTFGAVGLGKTEIFFCVGEQGQPGMWLCIFVSDVDVYHDKIKRLGAEVIQPPTDEPWGLREIHVKDPNQHVLRFGHGIPSRQPKLPVERVKMEVRVEKRLAALMSDLAEQKKMSVGEMIEEMMLHSFERVSEGGVASPHTEFTLECIPSLKRKHGIDYDCHASYRFSEE